MHRSALVALVCLALCLGWATAQPLPFDLPSTASLRASGKLAFAHYFTLFIRSLDNLPPAIDYYTRQWLDPAGEGGIHAAYGGFLRDRPYGRAPLPGNWTLTDMQTEVGEAIAAGLDGFTVDLLDISPSSYNWQRVLLMLTAANSVDVGFKIVPMPDMYSLTSVTPSGLAAALAVIASFPAAYRLPDNRLVVSPFLAEQHTPVWWQQVFGNLSSTYNISVAFFPCFLDFGGNRAAFKPISYGYSDWGGRSPAAQGSGAANAAAAHADGCLWMQPVSAQDNRPRSQVFDEAGNTETLRFSWNDAINGADWVQMPTWNDYSENAQVSPSVRNSWALLDISAYYLVRWKMGSFPPIVRDVVYLTHRTQLWSQTPTYNETLLMQLRAGSTPARNTVEVLSFLTAPANITLTIGTSNVSTWLAPAGVSATLLPLAFGNVSVVVYRGAAWVTGTASPFPVVAAPYVQDLGYYFTSSGRAPSLPPPTSVGPTAFPSASPSPTPSSTLTVAPTPPSSATPPPSGQPASAKSTFPKWAIALIVVASVVLVAVAAAIVYCLVKRPGKPRSQSGKNYVVDM